MDEMQVTCPACGALLGVPPDAAGRSVRCGSCQHRFQIPAPDSLSEDDIASLLDAADDKVDLAEQAHVDADEEPSLGSTIVASESIDRPTGVCLAKLGPSAAMFEFPAKLLREASFRCTMPRTCMRCGARAHLRPHVIVFASSLADKEALRSLLASGVLICCEPDIDRLYGADLLKHLPRVPNASPPADQPMPYWMCDMCNPEGLVVGQIIEHARTGEKTCRLRVANIHRAHEFLTDAGGSEADLAMLAKASDVAQENPWDQVPLVVRQRLEQWFKAEPDEHFIAYVPDRDLSRTEEGMAGLVVSDRRVVYHSHLRHKEAPNTEPIELELAMTRDEGLLKVKTVHWAVLRIAVDREGVRHLRRALTLGKFKAAWR